MLHVKQFTGYKFNYEILIFASQSKYLVFNDIGRGIRLKAEHKKTVESGNVNSPRSISKKRRKREAGKPLYLTRYE